MVLARANAMYHVGVRSVHHNSAFVCLQTRNGLVRLDIVYRSAESNLDDDESGHDTLISPGTRNKVAVGFKL